jgi:hypothetical protein
MFVLQALIIKKDHIEYMKTRVLAQALVNKEATDKALDEYRDLQMPYLARQKKDERSEHIKQLMSEVNKGALTVTPVMQKRVTSKMHTKVVKRSEEHVASANRVTKKLGGVL